MQRRRLQSRRLAGHCSGQRSPRRPPGSAKHQGLKLGARCQRAVLFALDLNYLSSDFRFDSDAVFGNSGLADVPPQPLRLGLRWRPRCALQAAAEREVVAPARLHPARQQPVRTRLHDAQPARGFRDRRTVAAVRRPARRDRSRLHRIDRRDARCARPRRRLSAAERWPQVCSEQRWASPSAQRQPTRFDARHRTSGRSCRLLPSRFFPCCCAALVGWCCAVFVGWR